MTRMVVEGPNGAVQQIHSALRSAVSDEISVLDIQDRPPPLGGRFPLGMEPLTYFVVVFAGHLAAGLAHDAIKEHVAPAVRKYLSKVTIREENEKEDKPKS